MRTIQVIDGADNCAYDCFLATEDLFRAIFPAEKQDIEFIEDFLERNPDHSHDTAFEEIWTRRVPKPEVRGIDGTLFYGLQYKKAFYPSKRDSDLDVRGRAQRA